MSSALFSPLTLEDALKNPYFLSNILEESNLSSLIKKNDFVGIKVHFGEKGNTSYLSPKLLSPFIKYLRRRCVKCEVCKENCPVQCIKKNSQGDYIINSKLCIGCA